MANLDPETWTDEKLRRRRSQARTMAELARNDHDTRDAERRDSEANRYDVILRARREDLRVDLVAQRDRQKADLRKTELLITQLVGRDVLDDLAKRKNEEQGQ